MTDFVQRFEILAEQAESRRRHGRQQCVRDQAIAQGHVIHDVG